MLRKNGWWGASVPRTWLVLWMECLHLPSKFLCGIPSPQCDGIRRRTLWEVIRSWGWSLVNGISVLIKGTTMWGYMEKCAVCMSEEGPHQNLTVLAPWPQTPSPKNCEKQMPSIYRPPSLWYLLQQPKRTVRIGKGTISVLLAPGSERMVESEAGASGSGDWQTDQGFLRNPAYSSLRPHSL